jgi:hypothetical protein
VARALRGDPLPSGYTKAALIGLWAAWTSPGERSRAAPKFITLVVVRARRQDAERVLDAARQALVSALQAKGNINFTVRQPSFVVTTAVVEAKGGGRSAEEIWTATVRIDIHRS